ncbi:MAG TPA: helix-turn-helix transcriptional regulator [Aggregatilineales bacterium]|nr:helix-turn-helix transcriptional regulator [Aggregatilineales bacterium]
MDDGEIMKRFGQQIRRLRLERGLSQEAFAAKCGLHRTYIGPIERGEKNITLATANKLAQALGTKLSTIFLGLEDDN